MRNWLPIFHCRLFCGKVEARTHTRIHARIHVEKRLVMHQDDHIATIKQLYTLNLLYFELHTWHALVRRTSFYMHIHNHTRLFTTENSFYIPFTGVL